jgi:hypothetical protein
MREGRLVAAVPELEEARAYARSQLARLPERLSSLQQATPYPVEFRAGETGKGRERR